MDVAGTVRRTGPVDKEPCATKAGVSMTVNSCQKQLSEGSAGLYRSLADQCSVMQSILNSICSNKHATIS